MGNPAGNIGNVLLPAGIAAHVKISGQRVALLRNLDGYAPYRKLKARIEVLTNRQGVVPQVIYAPV